MIDLLTTQDPGIKGKQKTILVHASLGISGECRLIEINDDFRCSPRCRNCPAKSGDDILVTREGKERYAVRSIGGFLGIGTRLVVVRYDSLKFVDVLPGGSKDGLEMLPAFEYSKKCRESW